MNALSNLRIGRRLAAGIAVILLLSVGATSFALFHASSNSAATRRMMEQPLATEGVMSDWLVLTYSAIARTSMIAKSTDDTLSTTFAATISHSVAKGSAWVKQVEALLTRDEEKVQFQNIVALRAR